MPGDDGSSAAKIEAAVKCGELSQEDLDASVKRILQFIAWKKEQAKKWPAVAVSAQEGHALAAKIAKESIVLLKNQGGILPLDPCLLYTSSGKPSGAVPRAGGQKPG